MILKRTYQIENSLFLSNLIIQHTHPLVWKFDLRNYYFFSKKWNLRVKNCYCWKTVRLENFNLTGNLNQHSLLLIFSRRISISLPNLADYQLLAPGQEYNENRKMDENDQLGLKVFASFASSNSTSDDNRPSKLRPATPPRPSQQPVYRNQIQINEVINKFILIKNSTRSLTWLLEKKIYDFYLKWHFWSKISRFRIWCDEIKWTQPFY
jgi:hypothetical protein